MDVVALSPLPTGSIVWRPRPDRWALTVVCKATFTLAPGISPLAPEQEPLRHRDEHWDGDPGRSLRAPSDLAPFKLRAEVLLVGSAHAPQRKPVRSLVARLIAGEVDKSVEVWCTRLWSQDGALRESARWTRMPLRYERAAGGPDTWNPVGLVAESAADVYGQRVLPNLQPPGLHIADAAQAIPPAGFGPIARTWPLRREWLGPRALAWSEEAWEREPLEGELDGAFFQAAPPDQQAPALRDDERLVLEHLHPDHPRLVTNLPGVRPRAFVEAPGAAPAPVPMQADTLWIDTDRGLCTLTWRGQVALAQRDAPGRVLVAMEEPGQQITGSGLAQQQARPPAPPPRRGFSAPEVTQLMPRPAIEEVDDDEMETVSMVTTDPRASSLPFAPPDPSRPPPQAAIPTGSAALPPRPSDAGSTLDLSGDALPATLPSWVAPPRSGPRAPASAPPSQPQQRPPAGPPARVPQAQPPAVVPQAAPPAMVPQAQPPAMVPQAPPAMVPQAPPPQPPAMVLGQPLGATPPPPPRGAPPPPPLVQLRDVEGRSLSNATYKGTLAASNAAAQSAARPPEDAPAAPAAKRPAEPEPAAPEGVELIWYDPAYVPRLRKNAAWSSLLRPPPRPQAPARGQPPPQPPPPEAQEEAARADVFSVLSRAQPSAEAQLVPGNAGAEGGQAAPDGPLFVVAGELSFPFDELEHLKAIVAAAAPLAATDKRLKDVLDLVEGVMKMPLQGVPEVVQSFTSRVREAWQAANKLLPGDYLTVHTERVLLNQRQYQKRELLDDEFIRALLAAPGSGAPLPAYVPAKLARRLPLFQRFKARLAVEVLPQQDQYEAHPLALRVVALARVLGGARPGGR